MNVSSRNARVIDRVDKGVRAADALSTMHDYALVVGIDHYKILSTLTGAIKDARKVTAWLSDSTGGNVPVEHIRTITSAADFSTDVAHAIDDAIEFVTRSAFESGGRRLYFYFSGHGLAGDGKDEVALCLPNWSNTRRHAALNVRDTLDMLVRSGVFLEIVLFLDCCRTWMPRATGRRPEVDFSMHPGRGTSCRTFLAHAAEVHKRAFEVEARGIFTDVLLAGLRGGAGEPGKAISASALQTWLQQTTERRARDVGLYQCAVVSHDLDVNATFGTLSPPSLLRIEFDKDTSESIAVLDAFGREVFRGGPRERLDLQLPPGLYMIVEVDTRCCQFVDHVPSESVSPVRFVPTNVAKDRSSGGRAGPFEVQFNQRGATITVLDGRGIAVHVCNENSCAELPVGLYRVRAERDGIVEERIVEHAGETVVSAPIVKRFSAAPLDDDAPSRARAARIATLSVVPSARAFEISDGESRLFVLLRRSAGAELVGLIDMAAAWVLDGGERMMAFGPSTLHMDEKAGLAAFCVRLRPGAFRLRHAGRDAREIAVHLYGGWATQVLIEHDSEGPRFDTLRMFLVPRDSAFRADDEITDAVDRGVSLLQRQTSEVPRPLVQVFQGKTLDDPLLGIIAGHLLARSPSTNPVLLESIANRVEQLIGPSPDAQALRFHAARHREGVIAWRPWADPPLLRASLEAFVEVSHSIPELIPASSRLETACIERRGDCAFTTWPVSTTNEDGWLALNVERIQRAALGGRLVSFDPIAVARELGVPPLAVERLLVRGLAPVSVGLEVTHGPLRGKKFVYSEEMNGITVGRDGSSKIALHGRDSEASSRHCVFDVDPPQIFVRDLGSKNGTYVNGIRHGARDVPSARVELHAGDHVRIGQNTFVVFIEQAPRMATVTADDVRRDLDAPAVALVQSIAEKPAPGNAPSLVKFEVDGHAIVRLLGQGGMGAVYLVRERSSGQERALKIMISRVAVRNDERKRFVREYEVLQRLDHPHIVRVVGHGAVGRAFYFTMELCSGGSVDDLLRKGDGRISVPEAVRIVLEALAGLEYAHEQGIVHRDVKPANILLSAPNEGFVKLADFGLAKQFDLAGFSGMTQTGQRAGTPAYMAPEQVIDFRHAEPPADVFSMAATLYRMITGKPPREVGAADTEFSAACSNPPIPVLQRGVAIPAKLARAIDVALSRDVRQRPQNAGAFRQALEEAMPG